MTRPGWVQQPAHDLPVTPDGLPPAWFWWTDNERSLYVRMCAADGPPGYQPPRITVDPTWWWLD